MNREHDLQAWPTPRPSRMATRTVLPTLIQVPTLPESCRGQARRSVHAGPRCAVRRPRRRLRREVRMAGCGMFLVGTLACVFPVLRGAVPPWLTQPERAGGMRSGRDPVGVAAAPPRISISIEPAALAPHAEVESPVVFPGYLLPDDGGEEPAHAGS